MHHRRKDPSPTKCEVNLGNIPHKNHLPKTLSSAVTVSAPTSPAETWGNATLYVLSGCSQPLIMALCKNAGLADPNCQLYMFFYALGPSFMIFPLLLKGTKWPSWTPLLKAAGICLFDIACTVTNYTGASMAGPTLFSIVYSSVTIWTAVFSQLILNRRLRRGQWLAVVTVFGGLTLTATDSLQLGEDVTLGVGMIFVGSAMHALTYIMSEGIMTLSEETLSVRQNNVVQSMVAATTLMLWQLCYTLPRWDEKIRQPMQAAGTTQTRALQILLMFSLSNLIHSTTFFHTLAFFPGGSTSAGVMKGLQAVLVFVITHFAYCGRMGGQEMCFSKTKFASLVTVSGGVMGYGIATSFCSSSQSTPHTSKPYKVVKGALNPSAGHMT